MRAGYWVLAVAALLAFWRLQTPAPLPVDAPPQAFSATRAFTDIKVIAEQPHPVGTPAHGLVVDHLLLRLTSLGLMPQQQSERALTDAFGHWAASAPITNIIATLKGQDSSLPAVLIISHYDSVPDSPGAADDGAGVASALEIARALKAGPPLPRDVVFLFSDGEELGLIGATAFVRHNTLAKHIGAVINLEARGDGGLAQMFETGANNAQTVALWAAKVARPSANSLARAIYKRMPNGTDFTPATAGGLPGVNIAFIGDEAAYHSALATPAHLNLGSVQHMGDEGLAAARAFGETIPGQTSDAIYFDVLGFFMVQYGFLLGWVLFGFTAVAVLVAIVAAQGTCAFSWQRGFLNMLAAITLPVLAVLASGLSFGSSDHFLRLDHFDFLLAGSLALAFGAAFVGATLFTRKHPPAAWQWLMLVNLGLAFLAQRFVPEASFFLVWPLLIAAVIAIIRFVVYRGEVGAVPMVIVSILTTLITAWMALFAVGLFTAVGVDMPVVIVLPILALLPIMLLLPGKPMPAPHALSLAVVGLLLFGYGRFAPYTDDRPAPSQIRRVTNLDSKEAYVVDYLDVGDAWTKAALGDEASHAPLPWNKAVKTWWAPAAPVTVPKTDLVFARAGADLLIVVTPKPGAYFTQITLGASHGLGEGLLDGAKTPAIAPGATQDLRYYAPGPDGVVWSLPAPKSGTVEVTVRTLYLGWPQGAEKLPPLPANKMAFGNTGATETVTHKVWKP